MTNDEYFKQQADRVRAMADKADPFTKKRLLDLADRYDAKLGKPSRATRQLRLPDIAEPHRGEYVDANSRFAIAPNLCEITRTRDAKPLKLGGYLVGAAGFEPTTCSTQNRSRRWTTRPRAANGIHIAPQIT
jgi:hypothetical protein